MNEDKEGRLVQFVMDKEHCEIFDEVKQELLKSKADDEEDLSNREVFLDCLRRQNSIFKISRGVDKLNSG